MDTTITSLEDFYQETAALRGKDIEKILPPDINKEIGHFNVFDIAQTMQQVKRKKGMPYNRRSYYKISLITGKNKAEYADKVIQVKENALLFGNPKVPYHWVPQDDEQSGTFCVFSTSFLANDNRNGLLNELPIFKPGGYPIFELTTAQFNDLSLIFNKMKQEITSDYQYKYDLLRNYVWELIHYGQKLQPASVSYPKHDASNRVIALFIELLERQFPIESTHQRLDLRKAKDYAERLSIHVNYLNRIVKQNTGKTTTEIISERIVREAKILLKQTDWHVSEISNSLGFEEVAHFSNFFKKRTSINPLAVRA